MRAPLRASTSGIRTIRRRWRPIVALAVFGYRGAWLGCAAVVALYLGWAFREYALQRSAAAAGDVHGGQ